MATPYVVPKISLPTESNEFDCDAVNSNGTRPGYAAGGCRFRCGNWCSVCEHQSNYSGRRKNSPDVIKLNGCGGDFNRKTDEENLNVPRHAASQFTDFKKISPAKNQNLESRLDNYDNKLSDYSPSFEKRCSPTSEVGGRNWLSNYANGVQERYLREVEALRGKLKELRESFPLPLTESAERNNLNSVGSKTKSVIPTSPIVTVKSLSGECNDSTPRDRKRSGTPNSQRIRQICSTELNTNSIVASSKRPRDGSPEGKRNNCITPMKGKFTLFNNCKPILKEAYSSLSLESEDNIESLEEEQDESDDEYEDDPKFINHAFKSASVSPSYVVGDTLGKISLNETQPYIQPVNPDIHPSIRPSLFSHVPPYIRFSNHEVKVEQPFPVPLQRVLKWKLTTITPVVVRKTVMNSGYKLVRKSPDWGGTWGKHMKSVCFKTLKTNQKLNHFPGTFQIGRKDRLWKNLYHLMTKFGKKEFGFIPRTYVMPQDNKLLRAAWEKSGGKAKWIIKPPASARGSGIKVIHKWTQIPKKVPLIVQKYISNPYLINGSKFDLRLYVLVTSFNPLRIYLYDNGLVRFASVKYSDDMNTLADRYMHLTNYSINKLSTQYTQNEDAEACQGHKWTVKTLWSYLEGSVNVDALWKSLSELVIKTMIAGESAISQLMWANLPSRYCSYELFGVDVLLDENLKPWLLEVNISPSLHSASPLDLAVKGPMVQNIMNIAGYHIPNKLSPPQEAEIVEKLGLQAPDLCYDSRLYVMGLSPEEKNKHNHFIHVYDRSSYLESILSDLTPDDVRHLVQYEDELTQIGRFEKIFPTPHTYYYQQFFDTQRYYNMLFDAWETKYHRNRIIGIELLESLCREQIHLDISNVEIRRSLVCVSDTTSLLNSEDGDFDKGIVMLKTRDSSSTTDDSTDKKQDDLLLNGIVAEAVGVD